MLSTKHALHKDLQNLNQADKQGKWGHVEKLTTSRRAEDKQGVKSKARSHTPQEFGYMQLARSYKRG